MLSRTMSIALECVYRAHENSVIVQYDQISGLDLLQGHCRTLSKGEMGKTRPLSMSSLEVGRSNRLSTSRREKIG